MHTYLGTQAHGAMKFAKAKPPGCAHLRCIRSGNTDAGQDWSARSFAGVIGTKVLACQRALGLCYTERCVQGGLRLCTSVQHLLDAVSVPDLLASDRVQVCLSCGPRASSQVWHLYPYKWHKLSMRFCEWPQSWPDRAGMCYGR